MAPYSPARNRCCSLSTSKDNFYPETRDDVDRDAYSAFVDRAAWLVAAATALSIPVVVTEEQAEANGPTEPRVRKYLNEATPILRKDFFAASDNPHIRQAIDAHPAARPWWCWVWRPKYA